MDRPVKRTATTPEWDALLARIRSHSNELEAGFAKSNLNLIEALSALNSLEELTSSHLAPPAAAAAAASTSAAVMQTSSQAQSQGFVPAESQANALAQAQARAQAQAFAQTQSLTQAQAQALAQAQVRYETSREEYAPALNQDALVEALLRFQKAKSIRQKISKPNLPKIVGTLTEPDPMDFSPLSFPTVDVELKKAPIGRNTSQGVRLPVLRVKNPGKPHGEQD